MKGKELDQSRNKLRVPLWMVMAVCITFTGCMRWGQPLLSRAVIQYDSNVLKADKELLLLNIVRMHDDQPPHFTAASNITASFSFGSTGGFAPSGWSNSSNGSNIALTLTATTTNNPIITIAPMQGKDFAQRILKPLDTGVAEMGLFQRAGQIDKLLRLIGHSFGLMRPDKAKGLADYPEKVINYLTSQEIGCFQKREDCTKDCIEDCVLVNRPPKKCEEEKPAKGKLTDTQSYKLFRQVLLHIKAIQMSGGLSFSPLEFDETIGTFPLKSAPEAKDMLDALAKQCRWEAAKQGNKKDKKDKKDNTDAPIPYVLKKRHIITGLVDSELSSTDLEKIAKDLGLNDYFKYDYPVVVVLLKKSNWPIYGFFRLRSFRQVLQFLAESLKDQCNYAREYYVNPSPFTKDLVDQQKLEPIDNPDLTLKISSNSSGTILLPPKAPTDRLIDVDYNGELFWVSDLSDKTIAPSRWDNPQPPRWNKQVFDLLYEIFQMNRVEPSVSAPSVTIPTK
jgi:hypothetical protein